MEKAGDDMRLPALLNATIRLVSQPDGWSVSQSVSQTLRSVSQSINRSLYSLSQTVRRSVSQLLLSVSQSTNLSVGLSVLEQMLSLNVSTFGKSWD